MSVCENLEMLLVGFFLGVISYFLGSYLYYRK